MPHQNNQPSGINGNIVNFDNSYSCLPEEFFQRINPAPVKSPKLIIFNNSLGENLGFDVNQTNEYYAQIFSGNIIPNGASPIALAYAGHQFGHFVNQLVCRRSWLSAWDNIGPRQMVAWSSDTMKPMDISSRPWH